MTLKTDEVERIERRIKSNRFFKSGEPFTVSEAFGTLGCYRDFPSVNARKIQTILHAMLHRGEIEKAGQKTYRAVSSKRHLITRPWRKISNAQLGIQPTQFGVPV